MLPGTGWTVVDDWSGPHPHGRPTVGMVLERGGAVGALALIERQDGAVDVQVNLHPPTYEENRP